MLAILPPPSPRTRPLPNSSSSTMYSRGRSRDVSPLAIARIGHDEYLQAQLSVSFIQQSNLHKTALSGTPQDSRSACYHAEQALRSLPQSQVASSSRLDCFPPPSSSQSSTGSFSPEATPSPMTPPELADEVYSIDSHCLDYYDSPPSPPRTLQDQIHTAYALENMHLAKILLLKLKGIEVTDDNDPRIAQVTDEDFASTFVPKGGLVLDEELERRCREGQRREAERQRRRARELRLRVCERVWERSAQCLRDEKARVLRKREEEVSRRRRAEIEARERVREMRARSKEQESSRYMRSVRSTRSRPRTVLSYGSLSSSSSRTSISSSCSPPKSHADKPLFEYSIMPVPSVRLSPSSLSSRNNSPNRAYRDLAAKDSRNVPFSDVVSSMHGPLFPPEEPPRTMLQRTAKQVELFQSLQVISIWDVEEPEVVDRTHIRQANVKVKEDCVACSLVSVTPQEASITSSPSTLLSRPASWFSFRSRSSRTSVSTALTSPSESDSSLSSPKVSYQFRPLSSTESPMPNSTPKHSCLLAGRFTPTLVATSQHPLSVPLEKPSTPPWVANPSITRGRPSTRRNFTNNTSINRDVSSRGGFVQRVSRSVSTFIDMATKFQRAYVKATMFTMGPDLYYPRSRSRSRTRSSTVERGCGTIRLRPEGYRVSCADVLVFTSSIDTTSSQPERPLIPLSVTSSIPAPPPPRVFPKPPPIPRSPFRLPQPPTTLTSRLRPVANPLLLRMRALQNVCGPQIIEVCDVREKVVGVAWEGIGRSGLVREVRAVA